LRIAAERESNVMRAPIGIAWVAAYALFCGVLLTHLHSLHLEDVIVFVGGTYFFLLGCVELNN
jgi:hypothetical protein